MPPVLACFTDQDARVRYYACEAMYNIAKVAKGEILIYFNDIFDALCKVMPPPSSYLAAPPLGWYSFVVSLQSDMSFVVLSLEQTQSYPSRTALNCSTDSLRTLSPSQLHPTYPSWKESWARNSPTKQTLRIALLRRPPSPYAASYLFSKNVSGLSIPSLANSLLAGLHCSILSPISSW